MTRVRREARCRTAGGCRRASRRLALLPTEQVPTYGELDWRIRSVGNTSTCRFELLVRAAVRCPTAELPVHPVPGRPTTAQTRGSNATDPKRSHEPDRSTMRVEISTHARDTPRATPRFHRPAPTGWFCTMGSPFARPGPPPPPHHHHHHRYLQGRGGSSPRLELARGAQLARQLRVVRRRGGEIHEAWQGARRRGGTA
jgi:hypothetical protein